ncbi:MAG: hypothetical protein ACOYB3_02015 [Azonexus sp.]
MILKDWVDRARGSEPAVGSQAEKYVPANPKPLSDPHVKSEPQKKPVSNPDREREFAAALSGRLGAARPPAMGTPSKEEERAAVLSGKLSTTVASAPEREAPVSNGAWGMFTPVEKPPNAVLQALNEVGFTVDSPAKPPGMPSESFSSTKPLAEHEYTVSAQENEYLRNSFNQPTVITGMNAGRVMPPETPVDTALPLMHMEPTESAALTWEAYDSLGDQQKAAVDWNTLLIDAREKDFSEALDVASPEQKVQYDSEVERLFGTAGGSERFAPNTMKLLSELDVVQLGQDLDEYLSLERAIDDTQIADFKFTEKDIATMNNLAGGDKELKQSYAATRTGGNLQAVNTANVQAAVDKIKVSLTNPEAVTASFDSLMYGNPEAGVVPLGFGDSKTDAAFQTALSVLGSEDVTQFGVPADADPLAFLLDDLTAQGADDATKSKFLEYVGQQSQLFGQYGSDEQKTMAALVNKRSGLGG